MSELAREQYSAICWSGDWRNLPQTCGGNVEVWDQTVGCPECGMNLWYLPDHGQWPEWDRDNEPPPTWWADWRALVESRRVAGEPIRDGDMNPYEPYFRLFSKLHPLQFEDGHDDGDAAYEYPEWTVGP